MNWKARVAPVTSEQPNTMLPGKRDAFETTPNGSTILWVIQDTYQGQTFFE
jgi:hypothetical protein